jgi:uncharacterized protein YprB with RNaseH-like and TPR domain
MSTALRERMRRAVATHADAARTSARRADAVSLPPIAQILRGDWHETEHGPVFVRDEWFPLDHAHGALPLRSALGVEAAALARLLGAVEAPHPSRLAFFDIETTGLSGGTGTYIVLAGSVVRRRRVPDAAVLLAGLAQERAMLAMLAADLRRFDGIVTYNGRAFDAVRRDALTMARLPSPWWMPHFDLLHPCGAVRHRMRAAVSPMPSGSCCASTARTTCRAG